MDDPDVETRLSRWFADTPAFEDSDAFTRRIERRLNRSWALRRGLIGAAGVGGGLIAVVQMLGVHLFEWLHDASQSSAVAVTEGAKAVLELRRLGDIPLGAEVLWTAGALAVLAVVLMATRSLEEF